MSELQKAAEQANIEDQRKREEKFRNATRRTKWQRKKRKLEAGSQNAGR